MFVDRVINSDLIESAKVRNMDKTTRGSTRFTAFFFKFGLGKQHSTEMDCVSERKEHRVFPFHVKKLCIFLFLFNLNFIGI